LWCASSWRLVTHLVFEACPSHLIAQDPSLGHNRPTDNQAVVRGVINTVFRNTEKVMDILKANIEDLEKDDLEKLDEFNKAITTEAKRLKLSKLVNDLTSYAAKYACDCYGWPDFQKIMQFMYKETDTEGQLLWPTRAR